jgi:UDP-glucuronate 4-epimerase
LKKGALTLPFLCVFEIGFSVVSRQAMKVLITGTAGFIGYHLAKRLAERGDEVVGLDNVNDYYDQNLKYGRLADSGILKECIQPNKLIQSEKYPNYRFIKLDLTDKENVMKLFEAEQFDALCNLAAQPGVRYSITNPDAYIQSNIVGFLNLLEAARHNNVKNFAYASSSSVYGLNEEQPFSTHHNVDHPISLYAASKKSNELMAHTYAHLYGLQTTGLRFFTVYGPWGRPDMAPFLFTNAAFKGDSINVFNNGDMQRDFTYIDDIVEGVIRIIDKPAQKNENWTGMNPDPASSSAAHKVYNIGNSDPVKLMDFIQAIENAVGKEIPKVMKPMQPGDVYSTYADTSELERDMGYKPSTPLQQGVNAFVEWYKSFYL